MPTLTRLDKDRITFKTIAEERPFIEPLTVPLLFLGIYGIATGPFTLHKLLVLIPFVLIPLVASALYLNLLVLGAWTRSEWLQIDLRRRTTRGRRGLWFRSERLDGPLDDFDHMRLVDARSDRHAEGAFWALELVWRKGTHLPFRVTCWRRPRSFHLERSRWGDVDPASLLHIVRALADATGLRAELPERYVESKGVLDFDLDLRARAAVAGAPP
jgi:hypothetical protein